MKQECSCVTISDRSKKSAKFGGEGLNTIVPVYSHGLTRTIVIISKFKKSVEACT